MSLKQKTIKGIIWIAIQNWGNQIVSFAVFPILARLLGPEAFGLIALTSVFLSFLQVFLDQGFGQAIIQRRDLEPEHLDTAFWTSMGMSVFLMGLTCASADLVAAFFKQPLLVPIIRWLSLSFLFTGLDSIQSTILSRELAFKTLATRSLIATVASGVVSVTMAFQGYGVWSLVAQTITNGVVSVAVLWSSTKWRPGFRFSVRHFNELFTYGINIVATNILNFFNRRADDFLIGYFLGPVALGYYTVAYRLLLITTQLLISTMQRISMPVFSKIQDDTERLRRAFFKSIQLTNLVAYPAFVCLSVLAPELITLLFGSQWQASIPVMQILGLVGFLQAGFFYNGPMLMALGKPHWNLRYNLFQAVCNVTCFLIAVRWGIVAVAASYVIRSYATSPVNVWLIRKALHFKVADYLRQYATPILASLVMTASILAAKAILQGTIDPRALFGLYLVIGLGGYVATVFVVAPSVLQEIRALVLSVVPAKHKKSA
ncbi:MAG: MOP flippase family protein [Lyngbya sp. HA4199-MV5]|jgi:PST family polysaccharide transporter|nr:MOP flippase family protein [Lyngbya sp. HA4199-MV5]